MRPLVFARALVLSCAAGLAATGCSAIFHIDDYTVGEPDAASPDGDPGDGQPDAGGGDAANQCEGAACFNVMCVSFDNVARIQGFVADAALPPLQDGGPEAGGGDGASGEGGKGGDGGGGTAGGDGGGDASSGGALPLCSRLPQPVYVIGPNSLEAVAGELGALASTLPITLVYTTAQSCDGPKAIAANQSAFDVGATTATYWDVSGTAHSCQLDSASAFADIGMSNVFADQCLTLPQGRAGLGDFLGPVTPGAIVAPSASTQTDISAEALYYIVGLGTATVAPWTMLGDVFVSPQLGAVQLDFGIEIGVPYSRWFGTPVTTGTQNIVKIATSPQPEMTLGLMSTDIAEAASTGSTIKELAYQDFGQSCAYYPNSTATGADKRNVRDGRYGIWGYTHMFAKVTGQNMPLNPNAAMIIGFFTGTTPTPTGNFLKFVIDSHLVPTCAMTVARSSEMGPLSGYAPSPSCNCYFDSIATGSSSCATCTTSSGCPSSAPHCNLGFCEAY